MNKVILLLAFLLVFNPSFSQIKLVVSEIPEWADVPEINLETKIKSDEVSDGYQNIIQNRQVKISSEHSYFHFGRKIFSSSGVQNGSEIRVTFNPAYEKLYFHKLIIWRNGVALDKLEPAKFKIFQNEQEQHKFLYNNTFTALMVLEDVRVNDLIEYAFSIKGSNPLFKGLFFRTFNLEQYDPIEELSIKIIVPENRNLVFKGYNNAQEPIIYNRGSEKIYKITKSNVPALKYDDMLPSWYYAGSYISFTEIESWKEVKRWAKDLYIFPDKADKKIQELALKLKSNYPNPEDQIIAALRFVQDEIRYTGFESGIGAYKPNPPAKVIGQRFGDCKDKTLLLINILQKLGIDAWPALVNTEEKHQVKEISPSPHAFDHVITKIKFNNNIYWVDPTYSYQRGTLNNNYIPNYKLALVLDDQHDRFFEEINVENKGGIHVSEIFDIEAVKGEKTSYKVTSTYTGYEADRIRYDFSTSRITDIHNNYLNYYANYFTEIEFEKDIGYLDDTIKNIIITEEYYIINNLWQKNEIDSNRVTCSFSPHNLIERLKTPKNKIRKSPIGIDYPLLFDFIIEVRLPEEWNVKNEEFNVNINSFNYTQKRVYRNKLLTLSYTLQFKQDYVAVDEVSDYLKKLDFINKNAGLDLTYTFSKNTSEDDSYISWLVIFLILVGFLGGTYICYRIFLYDPVVPDIKMEEKIGGWLILIATGLIFTPLILTIQFYNTGYLAFPVYDYLFNKDNLDFNPMLGLILVYEILGNTFLIIISVLLNLLFFTRRSSFPKIMIIYLLSNLAFLSLDVLLGVSFINISFEENIYPIGKLFLSVCIWVPYFLYSERVKDTFVKRLKSQRLTISESKVTST